MKYVAITIGPIYDVITDTLIKEKNKTKRLKAGSYFFSYFMKKLADNLKEKGFDIIVPYNDIDEENIAKMGIYHDRLIAKSDNIEEFECAYEKSFEDIASEYGLNKERLKKSMQNHYFFASEDELKEINENIIFAINTILDSLEQNKKLPLKDEENEIKKFQQKIVEGKKEEFKRVKTLEDIAGEFKYYAVINADGDSMGAKIKNEATQNPDNIKKISKKLYEFFIDIEGKKLDEVIEKFGGELIYAGGDDILAFVPLKSKESIFDLIEKIHKNFKAKVGNDVSMSFGVSVVYYKYPLKKAIEDSMNFLYEAKSFRKKENAKNGALAIQVMKHSGHYFKSFHIINSDKYEKFKVFIKRALNKTEKIPNSIQYKIMQYKDVIIEIYNNNRSVKPLFENIFNEASKESLEEILEVAEYFDMYRPKSEEEFNKLISDFHIVKFIRDKNETN